jgi:hypothetical protein
MTVDRPIAVESRSCDAECTVALKVTYEDGNPDPLVGQRLQEQAFARRR